MPRKSPPRPKKKTSAPLRAKAPAPPAPPPPHPSDIAAALTRFSTSPRFDFFRNLFVSEFTAARSKDSPVAGLTFGALEERLMDSGSLGDEVAALDSVDQHTLLRRIIELGGESTAPLPPPPETTPAEAPPPPRFAQIEKPVLSSVEAEKKLTEALAALRSSPRFSTVRLSRLGDFWDGSWPRAPFEEALTLQQVADMKVQAMLEKRSFGPAKIVHVIKAIERAIGSTPQASSTNRSDAAAPSRQPLHSSRSSPAPRWNVESERLPGHALATLRYLESFSESVDAERNPVVKLLSRLPETLTAREAAVSWFRQESDNDIVAGLMHMAPAAAADAYEAGNRKIRALFLDLAPSESRSWELALHGAGVTLKALLGVYPDGGAPRETLTAAAKMILGALGAKHPFVFGRTLGDYYTRAPEAAELILKRLISALPLADDQLRRELQILLPFMESAEVVSLISLHASFNERDSVWIKRGES